MARRTDPGPETTVAGRYRLLERLGGGGMATVHRARCLSTGQLVAVKRMHPFLAKEPSIVRRLRGEALAFARIEHPNVVRLLDSGIDDGVPFLVLQLVAGPSIAEWLARHGPLPVPEACRVACSVLSALQAAHRAGVVHRDLKPDNVRWEDPSGPPSRILLLDFGISALLDEIRDLTPPGRAMGTAWYASPEQLRGGPPSAAMDVYGTGVLLYEMLTGERPFQAADHHSLCQAIATEPPPPMSVFRRDVPDSVERVVLHALQKDPAQRPDAAALAAAIAAAIAAASP